jgi:hypothetical protein
MDMDESIDHVEPKNQINMKALLSKQLLALGLLGSRALWAHGLLGTWAIWLMGSWALGLLGT